MKFIYFAVILIYNFLIKITSVFNKKAKQFISGRKDWAKILGSKVDKNGRYIWFHCSSLGEFEQGRPLIEIIKKKYKQYKIVLTFFSPSGYEMRKNYDGADIVNYLPVDTPENAKIFLDLIKPEKVFFIKYEYWYFFLSEIAVRKIPLILVSAVFHTDSIFFKKNFIGRWYRDMLIKFDHLFVQDEKSVQLLREAGINRCSVAGDTRIDRVVAIAGDAKNIPLIEKFKGKSLLIVGGSTWKPDEDLLSKYINSSKDVKIIFAPHEVSETNIKRLQKIIEVPSVRFSKSDIKDIVNYKVLIIDSIGLLSSIYKYGSVAYIGGGFGVGIHNILEPAVFGLPVIFGPNHEKFKEATDLKALKGAYPVNNFRQLENVLNMFLNNPSALLTASDICRSYILKNIGAANIIINKVFNN